MKNIPSDLLQKILKKKRQEVAIKCRDISLSQIISKALNQPPTRGFTDALLDRANLSKLGVIAEIKKASPSKGIIRDNFDVISIAASYEAAGATCLSVLTDTSFFLGSEINLFDAHQACSLPILRKDFIIDPYQVAEARAIRADAILLIVAALNQDLMLELASFAREIGLDVLVEVHDYAELERALELDTEIIGINNRDLHNFTVKLDTTLDLLPYVPADKLVVTESGIVSRNDVAYMRKNGVSTFLVGEAMMRAPDPGFEFRSLFNGF